MNLTQLMPRSRRKALANRRDPFTSLQRHINELFEDMPTGFDDLLGEAPTRTTLRPRVDMVVEGELVRITAELAGVDKDDIEITLPGGNALVIKGEKKSEERKEEGGEIHVERTFGFFYRALPLPCEVVADAVEAKFDKGVLTIELPRAEVEERTTARIPIKD